VSSVNTRTSWWSEWDSSTVIKYRPSTYTCCTPSCGVSERRNDSSVTRRSSWDTWWGRSYTSPRTSVSTDSSGILWGWWWEHSTSHYCSICIMRLCDVYKTLPWSVCYCCCCCYYYYAPPRGGIKRWCCLTCVCLSSVCRVHPSGRRSACAAGRLDDAYWLIGPGSAGLAQGCRCALPLQAWAGAYRGGRPPTVCYYCCNSSSSSSSSSSNNSRFTSSVGHEFFLKKNEPHEPHSQQRIDSKHHHHHHHHHRQIL